MKKLERNKGTTLLELLAVIAIIGMMVAVSIPAFQKMSRGSRLRSGANSITNTLSWARQMAITYRRSYYVEFDDETTAPSPEKNRLRIFFVEKGGNPGTPDDRKQVGDWIDLPDQIVFFEGSAGIYKEPDDYVKFKPNGGATGATSPQPWTFTIYDKTTVESAAPDWDRAKTCNIYVLMVTGRIETVIE